MKPVPCTLRDTTTASGDTSDATPDDTADAPPADTAETADGGDADVIVGPRATLVIEGAGYPAFTEMARAGLARAAAEVTIADHEVVVDLEDPFDLMDDAAADSDLLITIGFLFVDLVVELAELHPDVHFVVIDGLGPELDNVSYVEFAAECSPQPNLGCGATSCCQDAAGYQSVCCGLAETFARRLCTGAGACAGGGYPCGVGVTGCAVCDDESTTFTTRCEVYHDGDGCQAIVE